MNTCNLTNYEISVAVKKALKQKQWSVRHCCKMYNENIQLIDSNYQNINPLDKDFVQRVRNNKFSVVTKRVVALCDFLGIDLKRNKVVNCVTLLEDEFIKFEKIISNNPLLEEKARKLLKNIIDVITCEEGPKNEIY
jgi:hypothetical protein